MLFRSFERAEGEVEMNGILYKYVKSRVYNDSLEMLCIPNTAKQQLLTSKDNFAKAVMDLQNDSNKKYKIAFFNQALQHEGIDKEIAQNIIALKNDLQNDGHEVAAIDFDLLDFIVPAYYVLTTAEASSNLGRYDGIRYGHVSEQKSTDFNEYIANNRTEGFGAEVKRRIMLGTFVLSTGYYDAYFAKAQKIRRLLVEKVTEIFATYDAIIMPVSPCTAFDIGQNDKDPVATYLADIFTVFANLTALPAIALPLFSHSNNMPYGVQVLCNKKHELLLLQISEMLLTHKTTSM